MVAPDGHRAAPALAVFGPPTFGGILSGRAGTGNRWIGETEPALAVGCFEAAVIHGTRRALVTDALQGSDTVVVVDTGLLVSARRALAYWSTRGGVHVDALVGSDAVVVVDTGLVILPRAAIAKGNRFTRLRIGIPREHDAATTLQAIDILVAGGTVPRLRAMPAIAVRTKAVVARAFDAKIAGAAVGVAVALAQDSIAVLQPLDVLEEFWPKTRSRIEMLAGLVAIDRSQALTKRACSLRKERGPTGLAP